MNKTFITNILISIISFVIISKGYAGFTFNICESTELKSNINSINISDCDPEQSERCIFKKGTNVTIAANFILHESVHGLKVKIYGKVFGVSVPWRVNPDNACMHGVVCPIQNNTENKFVLSMPISRAYPSIPVIVKLKLDDLRRRTHFCVEFPVKIED